MQLNDSVSSANNWIGAYIDAGALTLDLALDPKKPDESIDDAISKYYERLLEKTTGHLSLCINEAELSIDLMIYELHSYAQSPKWQQLTRDHPQIASGLLYLLWDAQFNWFMTPWTLAVTVRGDLMASQEVINEKLAAIRKINPTATYETALDITEKELPTRRSLARALGRSSLFDFKAWSVNYVSRTKALRGRKKRKVRQHCPATRDALERFAQSCAYTKKALELIDALLEIDGYLPSNQDGYVVPLFELLPKGKRGQGLLEEAKMQISEYCESSGSAPNYSACVRIENFGEHIVTLETIKDWRKAAQQLMKHLGQEGKKQRD